MPQPVTTNRNLPYGGPGALLVVPAEIWQRTLAMLRDYGRERSEGLVFWGGVVNAPGAYVTGLYLPRHAADGAHAMLTAEQSRWLLRSLRSRDEKLLAQVHSHPGTAYHSPGDNDGATSFHDGFISIVVPQFARGEPDLGRCAVFEFAGGAFAELAQREIPSRIRLSSFIEDRASPAAASEVKQTWLSTIVSNLKQKLTGWKKP
jgi:hypothetical protein